MSVHAVVLLLLAFLFLDKEPPANPTIDSKFIERAKEDLQVVVQVEDLNLTVESKKQSTADLASNLSAAAADSPSFDLPDLQPVIGESSAEPPQRKGPSSRKKRSRRKTAVSNKASFFGYEFVARSVVFVIDASGSMSGKRFDRARKELATSISQLKPHQQFFVIFYTHETFPMFWPNTINTMIPATPKNIRETLLWMERSTTDGGTQPQKSMVIALNLRPDVVFLLSDGQIPAETRQITFANNRRSIVHTIGFGSNIGATVMRLIAEDNRGGYRFIPDSF